MHILNIIKKPLKLNSEVYLQWKIYQNYIILEITASFKVNVIRFINYYKPETTSLNQLDENCQVFVQTNLLWFA